MKNWFFYLGAAYGISWGVLLCYGLSLIKKIRSIEKADRKENTYE